MMVIESVLGNVEDPSWKVRLEGARVDVVRLDQWQAQKNRFRRTTEGGVEVAVSLERNVHLHDGDILVWDEAARCAIIARIQLQHVMVIRLDDLLAEPPEILARTCLEVGHALGNQHWPAVVKGTTVYVPLTVSREVMNSVMKTHAFPGITYEFAPGGAVIPYLSPHESRRLFGGADSVPHSHLHAQLRSHGNDHEH
jgi:urease accessory protein